MKYFKTLIFAVLIFGTSVLSRADEGMWLIQNLTRDIVSKMEVKGLLIDGKAIYDEDNLSLSDAVVSL
ncbi:MAG: S46 family peptidase, partial [Bacteroidales bacterium]